MKKGLTLALALCLTALCACGAKPAQQPAEDVVPAVTATPTQSAAPEASTQPETSAPVESASKTISPMAGSVDVSNLTDGDYHVSFDATSARLDGDGRLVLDVTVYDYELFDAVEVSQLAVGDTFVAGGVKHTVNTIGESYGGVAINGGFEEEGGFTLVSNDGGTYRLLDYNDDCVYRVLGTVTLPVNGDEFVLTDDSDLENPGQTLLAGDLLSLPEEGSSYTPYDTTLHMENGKVLSIHRVFHP